MHIPNNIIINWPCIYESIFYSYDLIENFILTIAIFFFACTTCNNNQYNKNSFHIIYLLLIIQPPYSL